MEADHKMPIGSLWKLALTTNEDKLLSGAQTGHLHIYDLQNQMKLVHSIDTHEKFLTSVATVCEESVPQMAFEA